jgi:hypothetical protein
MTAKQKIFWNAVVIVFTFCPIYASALYPHTWGPAFCLVSIPVLLVSGVTLVFYHKTFLGLIPIIFALCYMFMVPHTYH